MSFKDKIVCFKKPKQTVYGRGKKLSKPRKQCIKNHFKSEEKKKLEMEQLEIFGNFLKQNKKTKERKELEKKKKQNERLIKEIMVRDIRTVFEQEED